MRSRPSIVFVRSLLGELILGDDRDRLGSARPASTRASRSPWRPVTAGQPSTTAPTTRTAIAAAGANARHHCAPPTPRNGFGSASMAADSLRHTCGGGTCGFEREARGANHAEVGDDCPARRARRQVRLDRRPLGLVHRPIDVIADLCLVVLAAHCLSCSRYTAQHRAQLHARLVYLRLRRAFRDTEQPSPPRCARTPRRRAARTRRGTRRGAERSPARGRCG